MKKGLFFLLLVTLSSLAACSSQDKPTLMYFHSGT